MAKDPNVARLETYEKQLKRSKDTIQGRVYTPEEAKAEFDLDLDPGWGVKLGLYEAAESGYGFTYVSPEGWEVRPDEAYVSPEGKTFTRADIETQQAAYEQQQADIGLLKPYQTPEGQYDIRAARDAGVSEDILSRIFGETLPGPQQPTKELPPLTAEQEVDELDQLGYSQLSALHKEYQRKGGTLEWEEWLSTGAPSRYVEEQRLEEAAIDRISEVFTSIDNLEDFEEIWDDPELFKEQFQASDAPAETKVKLLMDFGVEEEVITWLLAETISTTEGARQSFSDMLRDLPISLGAVGQVALGALGVAGAYVEQYVGRPWEAVLLEVKARDLLLMGNEYEKEEAQRTIDNINQVRRSYGWAAVFSEGILRKTGVLSDYEEFKERGGQGIPLSVWEWGNPAYLIPIGGTFGITAKATSKIPLLGRITKSTAAGVQALERGLAYPITKPLGLATRYGAKGAQAVGERIGKSMADKLITRSEKLLLEIPKSQQILNGVLVDNWQRKAIQTIAKISPIGKGIEKTLGWRILIKQESKAMQDIVGRAGVVHAEVSRMGINAKAVKYWELQELSRNPAKMFGFNKHGYSAKLNGNLEEVFTNPQVFELTSKQRAYVTRFNQVNDEILNLLKAEGVSPEHLVDDWVHRIVLTKGERARVARAIGAKPSYEKVRKFKTMADGIKYFMEHPELKAHYANNPELLLSDYIQSAFKKIADERFVRYVAKELEAAGKAFGVRPVEKLINFPELFETITTQAGRELAEKAVLRAEELTAAKQFKGVIDRALRGEKPPAATLAMLERKFPDVGKRFREAIGKKEELQLIKSEIAELAEARKLPFWEAKTERAFRMSQLRQPTLREGYVMQPFAGGKLYDREFIDAFNKFFGHEAGFPGLNTVSDVAGILRVTKAALDFSFQAIQGMPAWGLAHAYMLVDPKAGAKMLGAWYKTWIESTAAFFRPEVLAKAISKERDIALELVRFGGSARSIDYFEALSAQKGLGGAFAKLTTKIPLTPYQRAETAFFGAGQLVRQRFAKILMPKAIKQGKEFELARFLDRITGITDAATLGVPLTTRQLEQSFIWFAPNYTRACLTVLADIFRGGYTGAMTREAIGGMIAAGSAIYTATQYGLSSLDGKTEEEAWRDVQEGFGVREPIL